MTSGLDAVSVTNQWTTTVTSDETTELHISLTRSIEKVRQLPHTTMGFGMTVTQDSDTRQCHKTVALYSDTRQWHKTVTQYSDIRQWRKAVRKTVTQDSDMRRWHKTVTYDSGVRQWHNTITYESETVWWHKTVASDSDKRQCHKTVTQDSDHVSIKFPSLYVTFRLLQKCQVYVKIHVTSLCYKLLLCPHGPHRPVRTCSLVLVGPCNHHYNS